MVVIMIQTQKILTNSIIYITLQLNTNNITMSRRGVYKLKCKKPSKKLKKTFIFIKLIIF
jgi:hypothetical protein